MHIVFSLTKCIVNLFMQTSHISGKGRIFQRIPNRVKLITTFDILLSVCQQNKVVFLDVHKKKLLIYTWAKHLHLL